MSIGTIIQIFIKVRYMIETFIKVFLYNIIQCTNHNNYYNYDSNFLNQIET